MKPFHSILPLLVATVHGCGNSTYPSTDQITAIFSSISGSSPSYPTFFSHVSPHVNWTIEGTHPAAGVYTNRTILEATFARIAAVATEDAPLSLTLLQVIGGNCEEWSVQELQVYGICKSGLIFDNRYAWATRWDTNKTIVEARAYLDSALVSAALQQNEIGTLYTYADARNSIVPFVGLTKGVLDGATGLSQQT